jgi:hypothetical protein
LFHFFAVTPKFHSCHRGKARFPPPPLFIPLHPS